MNRQTKYLKRGYRKMDVAKGNKSSFKQYAIERATTQGPLQPDAIQWIRNKGMKKYRGDDLPRMLR